MQALPALVQEVGDAAIVLDASKHNLTDLPNWLRSLSNLQELVLVSNELQDVPEVLTCLNSLQV